MKISKLENQTISDNATVKVTEMGNVIEIQYMDKRNHKQTVKVLPGGNEYVIVSTGEIKQCKHHSTRYDNKVSLYKTFKTLRGIINSNVTDVSKVRWCTLTYAENMQDSKRLYQDFEKFNKRFQYYCKKNNYSKPEYIAVAEPQERGAWHMHLLYIFPTKAPFISNQDFANLWGQGFVKITKLDDVDNVGAYLTAYLGDLPLNDVDNAVQYIGSCVKIVESQEGDKKVSKAYIKGARLSLYPRDFNLYRTSRGIKRPIVSMSSYSKAKEKVLGGTKTYSASYQLTDDSINYNSIVIKEYYNTRRQSSQK